MAMMDDERQVFLDTNILVRANVSTAPLHSEITTALEKLRRRGTKLWISQQVLREYAATVTRPQTFMQPMDAPRVAVRLRYFQSNFSVAQDSAFLMGYLLYLLDTIPMGGKQVHDANIVATMQAYGIPQLFTLNTEDFVRFTGLVRLLTLAEILDAPPNVP
jgi:predicted nucleic acid-binding protein